MKKVLTTIILIVIGLMAFAGIANAATTDTLAEELYAKGQKYGMTTADKVKIERRSSFSFQIFEILQQSHDT